MFKKNVIRSSSLLVKPSFFYGLGRVVDIAGTFNSYNHSESDEEADLRAIANDWNVVGEDLEAAMAMSK